MRQRHEIKNVIKAFPCSWQLAICWDQKTSDGLESSHDPKASVSSLRLG
jgi:hypothetical protein